MLLKSGKASVLVNYFAHNNKAQTTS